MSRSRQETIDKEYPRFKFPGFGSTGTCFLRVRIRPHGMVVLCSQLLDYHGTSITNAVEKIFVEAVAQLEEEVGLNILVEASPWWKFGKKRRDAFSQIVRKTVWIEHYPPDAGLDPKGSFALVAFDSALHPVWNYVSAAEASAEGGVEPEFLRISPDRLRYGQ